jgi:hypothetical protein
MAAFPSLGQGQLPHYSFRGLLSVHSRYGPHIRRVANTTPLHQRLSVAWLPATTAPIATGWSESCRVGLTPTERPCLSTATRRVEMWRGGGSTDSTVAAPFVWRCLNRPSITPFPHPAHRTGRADLPHPALGQDLMPSPTAGGAYAARDGRALDARIGRSRGSVGNPGRLVDACRTATGAAAQWCRHQSPGRLC